MMNLHPTSIALRVMNKHLVRNAIIILDFVTGVIAMKHVTQKGVYMDAFGEQPVMLTTATQQRPRPRLLPQRLNPTAHATIRVRAPNATSILNSATGVSTMKHVIREVASMVVFGG